MDLATVQQFLRDDQAQAPYPFRSPAEMLVTLTEELGEVIKEVSLFERIGTKAGWEKAPSHANLTEEMLHLLNLVFVLANHYQIDLAQAYTEYMNRAQTE